MPDLSDINVNFAASLVKTPPDRAAGPLGEMLHCNTEVNYQMLYAVFMELREMNEHLRAVRDKLEAG